MEPKLVQVLRMLCEAIEAGHVNSAQREVLHRVRVILGDAEDVCPHRVTVYEEDDRLICQDCRLDVTPMQLSKV